MAKTNNEALDTAIFGKKTFQIPKKGNAKNIN
jgi:hypothetical protein